ncbi:MAG: VWA domain-containing protein [Halobacteriovoraceae bacterium]|nr:VWA domain-containing protein [Halobacteriovoraceae bacterium]
MYEYKTPYYFIIGLGALFAWTFLYWGIFKQSILYLPKNRQKKMFFPRVIVFLIGVCGWLSLSFAIMQPRKSIDYEKNKLKINDIFFVVDVSLSMLAIDFKPNRLEAAKKKIREFIKLRPKDRIGIIIFSEEVFTLMPLSRDLELVDQVVDEIKTRVLGSGTNIGDAIGLAVARGIKSVTENKVIILLTDGVSQVGTLTPLQAAKMAKDNNIKVYTIAIGGNKDAKMPSGRDLFGNIIYRNIPGGSYDVKTLKEIADTTGGKSYVVQNEGSLKEVLEEIEKLERTEIDSSSKIVFEEHYYEFFLYGLLLLMGAETARRVFLKEGLA